MFGKFVGEQPERAGKNHVVAELIGFRNCRLKLVMLTTLVTKTCGASASNLIGMAAGKPRLAVHQELFAPCHVDLSAWQLTVWQLASLRVSRGRGIVHIS